MCCTYTAAFHCARNPAPNTVAAHFSSKRFFAAAISGDRSPPVPPTPPPSPPSALLKDSVPPLAPPATTVRAAAAVAVVAVADGAVDDRGLRIKTEQRTARILRLQVCSSSTCRQ